VGDPPIVVFLSAGQCGTEWLASGFRDLYPELEVEHEPIGALYKPRLYFRRYADPDAILEVPQVRAHLARIDRTERPYVETGWPLFSALPLMAEWFGRRLRVVHLTRHPVPTALLHLAAQHYAGSPSDTPYSRYATLSADDQNVFQVFYAGCWDQLSAYERCVFWWTEVSLFGVEFPGRVSGIPVLRVRSEDLVGGDRRALERLLGFMDLPWHEGWVRHSRGVVDRWHEHTDERVDALEVHRHPTAVEVARQLGYDISRLNRGELYARYRGESFDRSA
jgi:hypothetical protein